MASSYAFAQIPVDSHKQRDLWQLQLENVRIKKQTVGLLLSELSLSHDIPIGFEIAPSDDQLGSYQLEFKKGTLSELLTQFVTEHDQYAWRIRDGVVNVFPKENSRDFLVQSLLETKINTFQVREKTSCLTLVRALLATMELQSVLNASGVDYRESGIGGFYIPQVGRHFTLDVSDSTLRSILNRVVSESPTAKFWVLTREQDGKLFLGFNARHEDTPPGLRFSVEDLIDP